MNFFKSILQGLYPYATFTVPSLSRAGGEGKERVVYLTFDDGPIPEVTPRVLAILAQYGIKATFFMVGENIDKHPEVFKQVLQAGHSIGNHTYNHLKGWKTPYSQYMANIAQWEDAFRRHLPSFNFQLSIPSDRALGQRTFNFQLLFRPPYGKATLRQRRAIHRRGYRLIYWDILTRDYDASVTPEQMMTNIRRNTRPGSIINFHDSLKSNERMLTVLPQAIEWLQAQGYQFLPLT